MWLATVQLLYVSRRILSVCYFPNVASSRWGSVRLLSHTHHWHKRIDRSMLHVKGWPGWNPSHLLMGSSFSISAQVCNWGYKKNEMLLHLMSNLGNGPAVSWEKVYLKKWRLHLLRYWFHAGCEVQDISVCLAVHRANTRKQREGTPVVLTPEWLPFLYHTFC